jgi:hypothetical protein
MNGPIAMGDFFKIPNVTNKKWGTIEAKITSQTVKGLEATTSAMSNLAKIEQQDDENRKKGNDDYILSFNGLMSAFDTFIREKYKNKLTAGTYQYDFNNPLDLTMKLCWLLRNPATHHGNVIDQDCKDKFELAYKKGESLGTHPILDLPSELPLGSAFTISWKHFSTLKSCVFDFISTKLAKEDVDILWMRSCVTSKLKDMTIGIEIEGFQIILSMNDLDNAGKVPKASKEGFELPACQVYVNDKRVIFVDDGTPVRATIWPLRSS